MARRPTLFDSRVLVTGASSGIGAQLARLLAAEGAKLLLVARREERLQALVDANRSAEIHMLVGDIADARFRREVADWVERHWDGLDVLVNNAGVGAVGPFVESDETCLRELFEVNFFAPVELIRLCLPLLRQGRDPAIVNIGSVLGHFAAKNKSEYSASKFALHGFSDALRAELHREGIHVMLVSPSTTRSEFFQQQRTAAARNPFRFGAMSAEDVAEKTLHALQKKRREIILSIGGRLSVWLDRALPSVMAWIQRR